ncbi:methyl-accepting chemotaxis protein [Desulfofundulus australicus]|nr:methyl-accepting chemotaxis protein [Desulfofundulus australicus]
MSRQVAWALSELQDHVQQVISTRQLQLYLTRQITAVKDYVQTGDARYFEEYQKYAGLARNLLQELEPVAVESGHASEMKQLKSLNERYVELVGNDVAPLVNAGELENAAKVNSDIAESVVLILLTSADQYVSIVEKDMQTVRDKTSIFTTRMVQISTVLGAAAFLLGLVVSFLVSRSVTRPVQMLTGLAGEMAAGDLTRQIPVTGRDELARLAAAFNNMAAGLRTLLQKVARHAHILAEHSDRMAAGGEEVSAAAEEMAASSARVAASVEQGAELSTRAKDISARVERQAREGNRVVQEAVAKMNAIYQASKITGEHIRELGQHSREIGRILEMISGIAGQTNLLALNAAIEAARAGEHGRGFAVVAEEVRQLAEGSARAAGEIAEIIQQIQEGIDRVVQAMEQGGKEIAEGVSMFTHVGEVLGEITAQIIQAQEMVAEVAGQMEEAAGGTRGLAASSQQVTGTIQELATAAQELARISAELKEIAASYKV